MVSPLIVVLHSLAGSMWDHAITLSEGKRWWSEPATPQALYSGGCHASIQKPAGGWTQDKPGRALTGLKGGLRLGCSTAYGRGVSHKPLIQS